MKDEFSAIAADDALLDALGRGEPAPEDDKLAGLVATWRRDLDEDQPADVDVTAILAALDEPAPLRPAVPVTAPAPAAAPRSRRWRGYLTGLAAGLVLIAGLGFGAGTAGPESPLWPIARVLYPERSDVRLAEHNIALAREAAADGRYDDARRTLDKATGSVSKIDDSKLADKLRAEIDRIRRDLPPTDIVPTIPSPSVSTPVPSPALPIPTGGAPGGGNEGGNEGGGGQGGQTRPPGGGAPTGEPGGGGIIPGLPAPTLPIPLPTITIPGLPLGTGS